MTTTDAMLPAIKVSKVLSHWNQVVRTFIETLRDTRETPYTCAKEKPEVENLPWTGLDGILGRFDQTGFRHLASRKNTTASKW
jgi:hypothetical protein